MYDWKLRIKKIKNMRLKRKIMCALIFISVFCILCSGAAGILIFKEIMIENAEKLSNNLVKQIAYNLDERIGEFESTSYRIVNLQGIRELLPKKNQEDDFVEHEDKNTRFADTIIQQPLLYQYSEYAVLKSRYGVMYQFNRSGSKMPEEENLKNKIAVLQEKVSKTQPICWTVLDEKIVFARLIVDNKTFEEKGLLCFFMNPSFFDFIDTEDELLSNKSLIIANAKGDIMQNFDFDIGNEPLKGIVFERDRNYFLKNYRAEYQGAEYQLTSILSGKKQWQVISLIKVSELMKKEPYILMAAGGIAVVSIGFAVFFTWIISKTIMKNITLMEENMIKIEKGDFKSRIRPASYDEIGMLGLQFNYMSTKMESLIDTLAKEKFAKQEAEFKTLQAQINPHFLYNTLGSVKWLANKKNDTEVEQMVDAIIFLMRSAIKKTDTYITVKEEIDYIKKYIYLQKAKYGEAFHIGYEIEPEVLECLILGFILQPLVENAIYHGIDMSTGDGRINISAAKKENNLIIRVSDNGVGFSEERLEEILQEEKKYKGFNSIGLKIVMERLSIYYKESYHFDIYSKEGMGTDIVISLPETVKERGEVHEQV